LGNGVHLQHDTSLGRPPPTNDQLAFPNADAAVMTVVEVTADPLQRAFFDIDPECSVLQRRFNHAALIFRLYRQTGSAPAGQPPLENGDIDVPDLDQPLTSYLSRPRGAACVIQYQLGAAVRGAFGNPIQKNHLINAGVTCTGHVT